MPPWQDVESVDFEKARNRENENRRASAEPKKKGTGSESRLGQRYAKREKKPAV
jgi:hypothetical protein